MRIVTIPDLHGKNAWKKVNINDYNLVIFLGDYIDSKKDFSTKQEIENLEEIIDLKTNFPEKIILLLGNHDIQYLYYPRFTCSYINFEALSTLTALFKKHEDKFQAAFQVNKHLWTHAGVSNSWFKTYAAASLEPNEFKTEDLADFLNILHLQYPHLTAAVGPARNGHSQSGGIFWADKSETENDFLAGLYQYVGHTKVTDITRIEKTDSSITYLDCLNSKINYLVTEI